MLSPIVSGFDRYGKPSCEVRHGMNKIIIQDKISNLSRNMDCCVRDVDLFFSVVIRLKHGPDPCNGYPVAI